MTRIPFFILGLGLLGLTSACGDAAGEGEGNSGGDGGDGGGSDSGDIDYEEGCHLVDGAGGYAWINDAIAVADPGSTIELCAANPLHEEEILVDKAVSIVGPGNGALILNGPTNTYTVTITASGASLSGVTINSTRHGIVVDGASNVSISNVEVIGAGQWGVKLEDVTDASLDGVTALGNAYGGINLAGGSASVTGATLTGNTAYGVLVTEGGALTLSESEISGTIYSDPEEVSDGHGVYVSDGGSAALENNSISDNFFVGVFADSGDVSLSGDQIDGSLYNVVGILGDVSIAGATLTNGAYNGVFVSNQGTVSVTDSTVSTDPELSIDVPYNEWGGDNGINGCGIFAVGNTVAIADTTVSGFNNCGILVGDPDQGGGAATVERTTIDNIGRYGLYIEYTPTTVTDVTVTNLRNPDLELDEAGDTQCGFLNYTDAVVTWYAPITWSGGEISDNDGWGWVSLYGDMAVDGLTMANNKCSGMVNYEGGLSVTGSSFSESHPDAIGSIYTQNSTSDYIGGNSFTDNQTPYEYEYEYTGTDYSYRYVYHYLGGLDIQAFTSADLVIEQNTFTDGNQGIVVYESDAELTDNTFTNYEDTVLTVYGENLVEVADNTFDGFRYHGVYCSGGTLEFDNNVFKNGATYSYDYDFYYNDEFQYTYTSSYTGYGFYAYNCDLYATDTEISDLEGHALYIYNYDSGTGSGSYWFDGLDISNVGTEAPTYYSNLYVNGSTGDFPLTITGLNFDTGSVTTALELTTSRGRIDLTLSDSTITGAADDALVLSGAGVAATLDGVDIVSSVGDGISVTYATLSMSDSTAGGAGSNGIWASYADITLDGVRLENSGGYGASLSTSLDFDGDGYTVAQGDCDDQDINRSPGANDNDSDGIDTDCDGTADDGTGTTDADGDGYTAATGDCDDTDAYAYPSAPHTQWRIDTDCDGVADLATGSVASISGLTATGNALSGLYLSGYGTAVVTDGSTFSSNGGYGIECTTDVLAACDDISFGTNTSGNMDNCGCD